MARELGHATHDDYCFRSQTIMNTKIPMVVTETASVFGEPPHRPPIKRSQNRHRKESDSVHILEGAGRVIFSVSSRAWFEQQIYDAIKRANT